MNKIKKINIVLAIIILIGCIFTSKAYAALNCNVNLTKTKDKVTYDEQFSVYVSISNLQTTKGIIAIGATLSYDTNSLTLVNIEGTNNWSNPFHNSSNGKITSFKNELSTNNENVFKINFKVNEKGKAANEAWIKISNFEISDGDEENNCGGNSINISIAEPNDENPGNNNQGGISGDNNQGGSSVDNNQNSGNSTQITKPNNGNTAKPPANNSNNGQGENTSNEETANNNVDTNVIENVIEGNSTDENNVSKNNNIQNTLENNGESKGNKTLFYILSSIAIIVIIGLLFLIMKYWKTN